MSARVQAPAARALGAALQTEDDRIVAVARVVLALVMLPHGLQKALGWFGGAGFAETVGWFTDALGMPWLLAVAAVVAESAGALALLVGACGRVAAAGIAANMVGAVAMVHAPLGLFMNWDGTLQGEGFEFHLLAIALAVVVVARGSGAWSIDRAVVLRLTTRRARDVMRVHHARAS